MLKYTVKKKGVLLNNVWFSDKADHTYYEPSFGKPERLVPHKDAPGAESYAEEDVLEEKIVIDDLGVEKKFVKLKAEYTIEIEDISSQYALEQVIMKRKLEYPSPEEFLDAMFDGGGEAIEKLKQRRLAIKAKYPKPGA